MSAQAASIEVENLADAGPGSLRAAIATANLDGALDTITFDESLSGTILLETALVSTGSIEIDGDDRITISRTQAAGAFTLLSGAMATDNRTFRLSNLDFRGDFELPITTGRAILVAPGGVGVSIVDSAIFVDVTVFNFIEAPADSGGGIFISNTTTVQLTDSVLDSNESGANGRGGGLYVQNSGQVTIADTVFESNSAGQEGGGIAVQSVLGLSVTGGGVADQVEFRFNGASDGGAIDASGVGANGVIITGAEFSENRAVNQGGAIDLPDDGLVSITGSRFEFNRAEGGGALSGYGFDTLNIDSTVFDNNSAGLGGALMLGGMVGPYGTVTITNSDFISNDTVGGVGGAIYGGDVDDDPFTIARSNFLFNTTTQEAGSLDGAAIFFNSVSDQLTVDSSTFAGNQLIGGISTEGVSISLDFISSDEGAVFTVLNSTFDEDTTTGKSTISIRDNQGAFSILYSTIVGAIPLVVDSGEVPLAQYVASTILQSGVGEEDILSDTEPLDVEYSVLSKAQTPAVSDLGHNQFATNALLGTLQNNGGRTDTRLPAANSPALSSGGPTLGAPLFDQRFTGFPRVVGTLDVGAVEIPAALANTGSSGLPVWVPIVGGIVLLAGIGFVVFSVLNRRKATGTPTAEVESAPEAGAGTGGDALFPEASTAPPTAEPPAEFGPGQDPRA